LAEDTRGPRPVITCASAATILADSQGQPGWMSRGRIEGHEIASPAPVINTPCTVGVGRRHNDKLCQQRDRIVGERVAGRGMIDRSPSPNLARIPPLSGQPCTSSANGLLGSRLDGAG